MPLEKRRQKKQSHWSLSVTRCCYTQTSLDIIYRYQIWCNRKKRPFYAFYNKFKKQTLSVKVLGHSHIQRQRPVGYQLISQRTLSDVRKHGTMPPIYWLLIIDKDSSSMTPKLFPPSPTCNAEHVVLSLSPVDETMTVYSRHLVRLFE